MKTRLYPTVIATVVALAGAVAMTSALAVEAEQYNPAPGTKTRAEVQAELAAAKRQSNVVQYGEATVFLDGASTLTRVQARDDSGNEMRVVQLGDATVFIDPPGTRTREDVRSETLAALRHRR
ncbi:DUF4148 domain-containing protein [Piscinibacter sp. XHJ-5]|uniref:DUF4148 domain-containing protein n=1 Tax=Piscinibacter sp. XHJ-5 TaxID=3037797 RepID=UPI002452D55A|nr:DUF4148 domain-containing protein [Piscinibacter sp. XHJ-5]